MGVPLTTGVAETMQWTIDAHLAAGRVVSDESIEHILDVVYTRARLTELATAYQGWATTLDRERDSVYPDRSNALMDKCRMELRRLTPDLLKQRNSLISACPHPPHLLSEEQHGVFVRSLPVWFYDDILGRKPTAESSHVCWFCTGRKVVWEGPWDAERGFVTYVGM